MILVMEAWTAHSLCVPTARMAIVEVRTMRPHACARLDGKVAPALRSRALRNALKMAVNVTPGSACAPRVLLASSVAIQ